MMRKNNVMINKYNKMSIASKASFWALISGIIQKGINVLATPIFTRILTTEEYAQYALYQSWHDIFIIFTSLNVFNYATYTAMVKYDDDKSGFISSAQSLITLLTLICFASYYIFHYICGDVIGFPILLVAIMFTDILFVSAFNLWSAKERYEFHYKAMTILSVVIGALGPFWGVIITRNVLNKGFGRIYGVAFVNIAVGMVIYIINFHNSKKYYDKEYWHFIIKFCVPLIPHFLSVQVLTRFDRIMIDKMCGTSEVGIYSLGYSVSMLMSIVNDAILKAYTPWTYQAINSNKVEKLKKLTNIVVILVALSNIILILFAPEAVKIFATDEYNEAIYIIPAVSASVFFIFLYNIFANIEYYYSETKWMALSSVVAAVVNFMLNYIFIPVFGFIAAGYTTLISYILYAIGHYLLMKRVSKKHADGYSFYDEKALFIISFVFIIISLGIAFIYRFTILRYIFILMMIIIVFIKRNMIVEWISTVKSN